MWVALVGRGLSGLNFRNQRISKAYPIVILLSRHSLPSPAYSKTEKTWETILSTDESPYFDRPLAYRTRSLSTSSSLRTSATAPMGGGRGEGWPFYEPKNTGTPVKSLPM